MILVAEGEILFYSAAGGGGDWWLNDMAWWIINGTENTVELIIVPKFVAILLMVMMIVDGRTNGRWVDGWGVSQDALGWVVNNRSVSNGRLGT